jgi:hypothetical protein
VDEKCFGSMLEEESARGTAEDMDRTSVGRGEGRAVWRVADKDMFARQKGCGDV